MSGYAHKSMKQKVFFILFCVLVIINPLPLGSNRTWAWSLEAVFAVVLLLGMMVCSQLSKTCDFSWGRLKNIRLELKLIGLWLGVIVLYIIPIPLFVLNTITPNIAQAYADIGLSYGYMSLDVYASYKMFLLSCYYTVLFVLGVVLINSRTRIAVVLFLMLILGVFEAVYGMYLVSIGQTGTLVQVESVSALHSSGTFINRNHLVAFLSVSFLLALGLRFIFSRRAIKFTTIGFKEWFVRYISEPLRLLDFMLFLLVVGIWSTHSRAGLASFILALLFYIFLWIYTLKNRKIRAKKILLIFIALLVISFFVSDDVNYYMQSLGQNAEDSGAYVINSAEGRLLAVEQAQNNMSKYWFSGVGPGAYQVFFVNHRMLEQSAYFDHAHNDYLEFVVEFGVFSLILGLLLVVFFYRLFVFTLKTTSQFYKALTISVLSVIFYMLLHGIFDFNARIPANVVTIIVAITLVYSKVVSQNPNNTDK